MHIDKMSHVQREIYLVVSLFIYFFRASDENVLHSIQIGSKSNGFDDACMST